MLEKKKADDKIQRAQEDEERKQNHKQELLLASAHGSRDMAIATEIALPTNPTKKK